MAIICNSRDEFTANTRVLDTYRGDVETRLNQLDQVDAYCIGCQQVQTLAVAPKTPPGEWRNLLEGMECPCGLNGRMRLILSVIDDVLLEDYCTGTTVILERLTPLYPHIEKRFPHLTGCEFLSLDLQPGTVEKHGEIDVRHENFQQLSFADDSVDVLLHFDVLEHVPDVQAAFHNASRVLTDDGCMVFSCPFYHHLDNNLVRAEMQGNELVHHLPASYHGNPVSEEGSLVFIHPSWELLAQLEKAGFSSVQMALNYSLSDGIVSNGCPVDEGHMWPVIFICKK